MNEIIVECIVLAASQFAEGKKLRKGSWYIGGLKYNKVLRAARAVLKT